MNIEFRLVETPEEYNRLRQLQHEIEGFSDELDYPTVYGYDLTKKRIVGFISTHVDSNNTLIAGPMVNDPAYKPRYEYAWAQVQAYDSVMSSLQIKQYLFSIERTNMKMFQAAASIGMMPYAMTETHYWYARYPGEFYGK